MTIAAGGLSLLLALGAQAAAACPGRMTIWDLRIGASVSEIPDRFVDYACGTRGGPPSRPLANFSDYARCPADERGLHEVYFRYDDEQEFIARALEQARAIEMCEGTRVFGIAVTASALFDAAGALQGIRIVTDPRGAEPADRSDHWALGAMLRHHFGDAGWVCRDIPAAEGETPVATYFIKDECAKTSGNAALLVRRAYLHRRGENFTDEFGRVQATSFFSNTYFEMMRIDSEAAAPAPARRGPIGAAPPDRE